MEAMNNLVPRAFPLIKKWPQPLFRGKALGTRLSGEKCCGAHVFDLKLLKEFFYLVFGIYNKNSFDSRIIYRWREIS